MGNIKPITMTREQLANAFGIIAESQVEAQEQEEVEVEETEVEEEVETPPVILPTSSCRATSRIYICYPNATTQDKELLMDLCVITILALALTVIVGRVISKGN